MWIKTQDKKQLADVGNAKFVKSGKKYFIMGIMKGINPDLAYLIELGRYQSEAEAFSELDKIEEAIVNSKKFYQMR